MQPLILVTNDDGIRSPGLHALAEVAAALGEPLVSAPAQQQTSMSRALIRGEGMGRIEQVPLALNGQTVTGYGVYGSPAMAAAHGVIELATRKPALCLSGINYGENIGYSITRSGTLGAALEAASFGIPALAVSLESSPDAHYAQDFPPMDWATAMWITRQVGQWILEEGMPIGVDVININVPEGATPQSPVRWTRQSRHSYYSYNERVQRDFTSAHRLVQTRVTPPDVEIDSDIYAFSVERAITLTPLTGNLTAQVPGTMPFMG